MTQKWYLSMSEAPATAGTSAPLATVEEFPSADESLVEETNKILSVKPINTWGFLVTNWKSWYFTYKSSDKN